MTWSGLFALVLLPLTASAAQTIDLSYQFPEAAKVQRANTCFMHASVGLLEAALFRIGRSTAESRIVLDDSIALLSFHRELLAEKGSIPKSIPVEWVWANQKGLALNLWFYRSDKIKSPF